MVATLRTSLRRRIGWNTHIAPQPTWAIPRVTARTR
jgi:hypothetical protein